MVQVGAHVRVQAGPCSAQLNPGQRSSTPFNLLIKHNQPWSKGLSILQTELNLFAQAVELMSNTGIWTGYNIVTATRGLFV